jgi:hypothetical protein
MLSPCFSASSAVEFRHALWLSIASSSSSSDRGEIPSSPRGRGIDLHEFDLIAGERRVRRDLGEARKRSGSPPALNNALFDEAQIRGQFFNLIS